MRWNLVVTAVGLVCLCGSAPRALFAQSDSSRSVTWWVNFGLGAERFQLGFERSESTSRVRLLSLEASEPRFFFHSARRGAAARAPTSIWNTPSTRRMRRAAG